MTQEIKKFEINDILKFSQDRIYRLIGQTKKSYVFKRLKLELINQIQNSQYMNNYTCIYIITNEYESDAKYYIPKNSDRYNNIIYVNINDFIIFDIYDN